jgi:5-methylcytosine-specific restriction endonuclease McrBC GTP-binding regulatory subunit McrB
VFLVSLCIAWSIRGIKGSVKTQYANLNNQQTGMLHTAQGYHFFIPTNIYLIGTMNTIDRSIESLTLHSDVDFVGKKLRQIPDF